MSGTVSRGRQAGHQASEQQAGAWAATDAEGPRGRRRSGWVAAGLVAVAVAGAVSAWGAGALSSAASPGTGQGAAPPATQAVMRQDLSSTTPVNATLGYAHSYTVTGKGRGTLTWLPSAGQVIRQGQALYKTANDSPAVLLYGTIPAWRTLDEGTIGAAIAARLRRRIEVLDGHIVADTGAMPAGQGATS